MPDEPDMSLYLLKNSSVKQNFLWSSENCHKILRLHFVVIFFRIGVLDSGRSTNISKKTITSGIVIIHDKISKGQIGRPTLMQSRWSHFGIKIVSFIQIIKIIQKKAKDTFLLSYIRNSNLSRVLTEAITLPPIQKRICRAFALFISNFQIDYAVRFRR